jgi:hypothetical protein
MATMATKFPPEFLQAVEEQTVMSGMGEELESAPTSGSHRESREDPITMEPPQPGGFQNLLNSEFPATPDLDATAMRIRGFLEKGARQADAARQEFDKELHDFRAEREDLHEDMQLLHADRVDPRSINGMVEESIASRLRAINADMLGVVSTLASIRDVQQSSAARFAALNEELHAELSSQHSTLMSMAASNRMRDAQLATHSERLDKMENLFDRLDTQLPNMERCVEVCSEVGSSSTAIASTLTTIRDQTLTTAQTVTQR